MKITKRILIISVCLLLVMVARAQDIHFSQFQSAAMHLSPAATGMMEEKGRFNLQYRNQWAPVLGNKDAFKTMSASYEHRFDLKSQDFFGVGGVVWQDKAGALRHSQFRTAIAYARKMGGYDRTAHYLIGGGEVGYSNYNLDMSDRRWVSQYDGNGGFDPTKQVDPVAFTTVNYADISMGLAWHSTFKGKHQVFVGGAIHHLNRAELAFDNSIYQNLHEKISVHGGGEYRLNRLFALNPAILYMKQGPHQQIIGGTSLRIYYRELDNISFQVGSWYRMANKLDEKGFWADAVVGVFRVDWAQFAGAISYDINVSTLRLVNPANNAVELLLSYRFPFAQSAKRVVTPRYF
jgi:type IX secretion system PorP/SprF family membrane protein